MNFQKMVLSIASFLLLGMLVFIGYVISKGQSEKSSRQYYLSVLTIGQ